jgi:hypothetical protein
MEPFLLMLNTCTSVDTIGTENHIAYGVPFALLIP